MEKRDGVWHFKWAKPEHPNGFIFKYNLRFVNKMTNKTLGPLCHALTDSLYVSLDSFLLNEGQTYVIQVQTVTTAGAGPWSSPMVEYHVPSLPRYCKCPLLTITPFTSGQFQLGCCLDDKLMLPVIGSVSVIVLMAVLIFVLLK